MATKIINLQAELYKVSDAEPDSRFRSWAKFVEKVDAAHTDGYAFVGEFVPAGTTEIEIRPRLFLTAITHGSRANNVMSYQIIRMDAEGNLVPTDIKTNSYERGWALRIRERVAKLLAEINAAPAAEPPSPLAGISTDDLLAELARRGIAIPAAA